MPREGGILTLTGKNLGSASTEITAKIGCDDSELPGLNVLTHGHTWVQLQIPYGHGARLQIELTVSGQSSCSSPYAFEYVPPQVQAIIPESPRLQEVPEPSSNIIIIGNGFLNNSYLSVRFEVGNDVYEYDISSNELHNSTHAVVTAPHGCDGSPRLVVLSGPTKETAQQSAEFVFSFAAPIISSVTPLSPASTYGGFLVDILGSNLAIDDPSCFICVWIDGFECALVGRATVNSLRCAAPRGYGLALVDFMGPSGEVKFSGLQYAAPTISKLEPTTGNTDGGYSIVITGTNFGLQPTVK